jgi:AI-2 transport protein TqsA
MSDPRLAEANGATRVRRRASQSKPALTGAGRRQTGARDGADRPLRPVSRPVQLSRSLTLLVTAAAFAVIVAAVKVLAEMVGPIFLAVVLIVTLYPLHGVLVRRRFRSWAASLVLLLASYLIIVALALSVLASIGRLGDLISQYSTQLDQDSADFGGWLRDIGVGGKQADAASGALDPARLESLMTSVFSSVVGVASSLALLVVVLFFIALDTPNAVRSLERLTTRPYLVQAMHSFAHSTRMYMGVSAVFGFAVAVIDTAALWLMGVPGAFVWGVLSFVTNFIPNIGFFIGLVPPTILAGLEGGWPLALGVIAVYCLINFVLQSLIQPRVVGDVVGLTPTLTFVSLVFWAWVLGPLGGLLAVPLTLFVRAVLVEADPSAHWVLPLISGDSTAHKDP